METGNGTGQHTTTAVQEAERILSEHHTVKAKVITRRFRLHKATPGALQFREVEPEGQPPISGSVYLKKWIVPQPYPDEITVQFTIPPGVDLTGRS